MNYEKKNIKNSMYRVYITFSDYGYKRCDFKQIK